MILGKNRIIFTMQIAEKLIHFRAVADSAAKNALLGQLPASVEARYDSYIEGSSPLCLKDTRIEVLANIFKWIDRDFARVFWLHGMAGTGKSTISQTLARALDRLDQLGDSFFFKRGDTDRKTIRNFSSTIASALAVRYPLASTQIPKAITGIPTLPPNRLMSNFNVLC